MLKIVSLGFLILSARGVWLDALRQDADAAAQIYSPAVSTAINGTEVTLLTLGKFVKNWSNFTNFSLSGSPYFSSNISFPDVGMDPQDLALVFEESLGLLAPALVETGSFFGTNFSSTDPNCSAYNGMPLVLAV